MKKTNIEKLEELTEALYIKEETLEKERIKLKSNVMVLDIITRAFATYINNKDEKALFAFLLDELLLVTGCEYGYIGEVKYEDDGSVYLQAKSITDISWNEETKTLFEKSKAEGLKFTNMDTLFGYGIVNGTTVISNDPDNDVRAGGRPEGHPPMHNYLGLPFFYKGKIIGQIGIANREGGFDADLIETLEPFKLACGTVLGS